MCAKTQALLGANKYKQLPFLHVAVSTNHLDEERVRFRESLRTPVGSSTRLQTNLTGSRRAAGAEAPSSPNSLSLPDSFLSSPVSKPASCDSLIGVGKERQ